MIILISPAKTLDFETPPVTDEFTTCDFLTDSAKLIKELKTYTSDDIASLMGLSTKLSDLNRDRFKNWKRPKAAGENNKACVLAFKGDVYTGLDAESFDEADFEYAQNHLRILSGLYGLLRPLDLIQPYRLEMGTKLNIGGHKNLYQFWGEKITKAVGKALKQNGDDILINLASNEYYSSIKPASLKCRVVTPVFKDCKNGKYKIISFFAKKARGMLSRYIIQNKLTDVESIKKFDTAGYYYSPEESNEDTIVFLRDEQG